MTRIILIALSAAVAAGILFVNMYTSVIDAVNWGSAIPHSLTAAREYFATVNPGNFFRIASPMNQVLALIALIACWKYGRVRYIALAALVLAVSADALTFAYFYPRNEIMFVNPLPADPESLRRVWEQWTTMNWFRSGINATQAILGMTALVVTTKKSAL